MSVSRDDEVAVPPAPQDTPKAVVKNVDMEQEMQQAIIELAADAMVRFAVEKDMAAHIKRTADERYSPTWHVIVGRSFGSFVTHGTWCDCTNWQNPNILSTFVCIYRTHNRPGHDGLFDLARLNASIKPSIEFKPTSAHTYLHITCIDIARMLRFVLGC